jgi:hypothetical protein
LAAKYEKGETIPRLSPLEVLFTFSLIGMGFLLAKSKGKQRGRFSDVVSKSKELLLIGILSLWAKSSDGSHT